jgi:hypothetical protein
MAQIKVGSLITHNLLVGLGATCSQLGAFDKEWPNGCRLRLKNLLRAARLGISVDWFAARIFPGIGFGTEFNKYHRRYYGIYRDHDGEDNIHLDAARAFWDTIKERS